LRELLWMAEARQKAAWSHTSVLCALIANTHRDPKKTRLFKPADFDPFNRKQRRAVMVDKETIGFLRQAFTGASKP